MLAVILQVAKRTERPAWKHAAAQLLEHCLAWPSDLSGVEDPFLCHGAIGVAHVWNRIFQADRDPRCLEAAVAWFELAMKMPEADGDALRIRSSRILAPGASGLFADGPIGMALALLAAVSPVEPAWDRMMALSGRPLHKHTEGTAYP